MKKIFLFFGVFLHAIISFSQHDNHIATIDDEVEIIDQYIDSTVFSLDPEEFLDKVADHGAELNGYYEHDRLKKIVKKIGTPSAMLVTIYYFWNDELIKVIYKQNKYMETKNTLGQLVADYTNSYVKYEAGFYFHKGTQIKKTVIGSPVKGIELEKKILDYSSRMKSLLNNKFNNRMTYQTLQGKWINIEMPGEDMLFEETIRFNFREGQFLKKLKVKIKGDVMYCSSPNDKYVYKYQIKSLTNTDLVMQDLQNPSADLIVYKKFLNEESSISSW